VGYGIGRPAHGLLERVQIRRGFVDSQAAALRQRRTKPTFAFAVETTATSDSLAAEIFHNSAIQ